METVSIDRPISANEAAIIGWLLDNAPMVDVAPYRTRPPEELRVQSACDCGCISVGFQPQLYPRGARIIADALAVYPDGQQAGLILWGLDGSIVSLEVYDCHPDASHRMPGIVDLRTWDHSPSVSPD